MIFISTYVLNHIRENWFVPRTHSSFILCIRVFEGWLAISNCISLLSSIDIHSAGVYNLCVHRTIFFYPCLSSRLRIILSSLPINSRLQFYKRKKKKIKRTTDWLMTIFQLTLKLQLCGQSFFHVPIHNVILLGCTSRMKYQVANAHCATERERKQKKKSKRYNVPHSQGKSMKER